MTTFRRAAVFARAACAAFGGQLGARATDSTAPELAAALQRKYDGVKDFSADFTHAYEGGVLRKQITERGHLLVKKPGKMRWDYSAPNQKQFVSDGVKMYSYIPQDKQVIVTSVPPEDEATTPTLFLTGKGHLARDFTASLVDAPAGMPAGSPAGASTSDAVKSRARWPLPVRNSVGVVASSSGGTDVTITCLSCGMYEYIFTPSDTNCFWLGAE